MSSRREKLLQKLDPKFLEITPKLSSGPNSIVNLDSKEETLSEGAKELMLRFFKKQEMFFNTSIKEDGLELSDLKYQERYRICESISKRLSLPFCSEGEFNLERPGKKLQDLKKKLEEKMSIKRKEEYEKRLDEYQKWKSEQKEKENKEAEEFEACEDEIKSINEGNESDNNDENDNISNDNYDADNDDDDEDSDKNDNNVDDNESNVHVNMNNDTTEIENTVAGNIVENNANIAFSENKENECTNRFSGSEYSNSTNKSLDMPGRNILNYSKNEVAKENYNSNNIMHNNESDSDQSCFLPPYQRGGCSMSTVFEQTQYSQSLPSNLLSPLKETVMIESEISKSSIDSPHQNKNTEENSILWPSKKFSLMFFNSQNLNESYDLNDAFEFCSGKFPGETSQRLSQVKSNSNESKESDNNETKDLNLGKSKKRIITYDKTDDDDDDVDGTHFEDDDKNGNNDDYDARENEEPKGQRIMSDDENCFNVENFRPAKRRKKRILNFSDEENDTNDINHDKGNNDDDNEDDVDENTDSSSEKRSVFYDSEENEIVNPKDFFEREAELSGSEFSGDEDERGLDEFDEEAGDADKLDYRKIQSELGKIHIQRLLDEDSRNVRLLQELFFEDGDLYADDNYKKFKWRNLTKPDNEPQSAAVDGDRKDEYVESSDEEETEDIKTRKERLKRQLLVEKMKENGELSFQGDLFKNVFRKLKVTTIRNELKLEKENRGGQDGGENFSKSTAISAVNLDIASLNAARGSFLRRNEELLSRLAKATAAAENVQGSKNSKNFVFAMKSPEKPKCEKPEIKRSHEESKNTQSKKKAKLLSEYVSAQIPSILDLLE